MILNVILFYVIYKQFDVFDVAPEQKLDVRLVYYINTIFFLFWLWFAVSTIFWSLQVIRFCSFSMFFHLVFFNEFSIYIYVHVLPYRKEKFINVCMVNRAGVSGIVALTECACEILYILCSLIHSILLPTSYQHNTHIVQFVFFMPNWLFCWWWLHHSMCLSITFEILYGHIHII